MRQGFSSFSCDLPQVFIRCFPSSLWTAAVGFIKKARQMARPCFFV